jgi:hypothetical protein
MTFPRLIKKSRGPPGVLKLFIRQTRSSSRDPFPFWRRLPRGARQRRADDLKDRLGAFRHPRFVPMPIDFVVEGRGIPTARPESRRQIEDVQIRALAHPVQQVGIQLRLR